MSADRELARGIESAFRAVERERMHGLPILNPALRVEAVGFRRHQDEWLGMLITPWFINIMLLPGGGASRRWPQGVNVEVAFPAGTFGFVGAHLPAIGDYGACSLFSPVLEIEDQLAARIIAVTALASLMRSDVEALAAAAEDAPPAPEPALSRRAFISRARPAR